MTSLEPGDKLPTFSTTDQNGNSITEASLKGKKHIIYFYPKDDTPTCTKESCNLRDNYSKLKAQGYEVIGVSPDTEKKHLKFIDKYELPFDLLADTDREVANAFEVYGKKKFMGREVMGIYRTTFVINEKGIIENIIKKVKAKEHADQILSL